MSDDGDTVPHDRELTAEQMREIWEHANVIAGRKFVTFTVTLPPNTKPRAPQHDPETLERNRLVALSEEIRESTRREPRFDFVRPVSPALLEQLGPKLPKDDPPVSIDGFAVLRIKLEWGPKEQDGYRNVGVYVQPALNADSGEVERQPVRAVGSINMRHDVGAQVRSAIMRALGHEVDEWLRYNGDFVHDPHPEG